jgi:hypothetical protein
MVPWRTLSALISRFALKTHSEAIVGVTVYTRIVFLEKSWLTSITLAYGFAGVAVFDLTWFTDCTKQKALTLGALIIRQGKEHHQPQGPS